jgi:dTDP-4-dehydrorhamnose reductase
VTHVVVLGAGGMLATDLIAAAPDDVRVDAVRRAELDVTDSEAIARMMDERRPDWIVNASAYTQVDRAETDYENALAVNGTAVTRIGVLCARRGVRVVHFSTDYVFRGDARQPYREDDPPDPVNAYGRSKLAGEAGLFASGARSLILRTQWLYGLAGKSFPRTMWDRARKGLPTRVVSDQFGRPTSTVDLARATWELIRQDAHGLYHVANSGEPASWFDVADAIFGAAGKPTLVSACTTADYPTPAARPTYSVMDTSKLTRDAGVSLPSWRGSLARFLEMLSMESAPERDGLRTAT